MQSNPRISVNLLVILAKILVNLLVKLAIPPKDGFENKSTTYVIRTVEDQEQNNLAIELEEYHLVRS